MRTKDDIQYEAIQAYRFNNNWGLLAMATGTGKSKVAVDLVREICEKKPDAVCVLVVPTIKLRDTNWYEEFEKWGALDCWKNIKRVCYKSILTIKDEEVELLILDEAHNITPPHTSFFLSNNVYRCVALSATPPNPDGNDGDKEKVEIFKKLKLYPAVYEYSLDEAVKEGIVAPYDVHVVECYLDNLEKYIQGGTKKKPFMQTEYAAYQYIDRICKKMMYSKNPAVKFKLLERMRLVKNLKSKRLVGIELMDHVIPAHERYLIFFGSIEQANLVMGDRVYHSASTDEALIAFREGRINKLGVVDALNEGHNIENIDGILIFQLDSQKRKLTQRIGRAIRWRDGHRARVWILVTLATQDEVWFKKAIEDLDSSVFTYHHFKNLSQLNVD